MDRIFAIGDIHGCARTFRKLVTDIIQLDKSDELYCLGDYVDRGPDSKGVIDFILELRQQGFKVFTLRGNHDQMMMDAADDDERFSFWIANGGNPTRKSFGIKSFHELESKYKQFFYDTSFHFETGNFILVHAGLNFMPDDIFEDTHAMMWTRNFFVNENKLAGRTIIHGHTPIPLEHIISQHNLNVINIDAGCVYKTTGLGHLVAIELGSKTFFYLKNEEMASK